MDLRLYDTLTRRKRAFAPLDRNRVRMYVCGPTVYDFAHVGNARPVIVFDVLFRLLRHRYGADRVVYVRNITDVDDKINARAAEEYPDLPLNEAIRAVAETTERQFHEDADALGCLRPTVEPRATEHIAEMRDLVEQLLASGHAYVAEQHVLFSVPSMPDYGRLSRRPLDEMIAGARVDVAPYKRDPMDFVLWKPSQAGEPAWPSPAGIAAPGRPGWHIECSAMSDRWLWTEETSRLSASGLAHPHRFDIHAGGIDLVFPHHENEIAQSRCAFQVPAMANFWMHNGFLQVEGEKMAKSAGNFVTIRELREGWRGRAWPGEVIRFAMLMTHYRQPLDFSQHALEQASTALDGFAASACCHSEASPSGEFLEALHDDLNTPRAIAELHRLSKAWREGTLVPGEGRAGTMLEEPDRGPAGQLAAGLRFLGVDIGRYDRNWFQKQAQSELSAEARHDIELLIETRNAARKARNFNEADRIRDELQEMGIEVEDRKNGTTVWKVK